MECKVVFSRRHSLDHFSCATKTPGRWAVFAVPNWPVTRSFQADSPQPPELILGTLGSQIPK